MHEVGLMESALEIALKHGEANHADRIIRITMRIGKLSGVEPEALAFAFEALKQDTLADRAVLDIETVPIRLVCQDCGDEYSPDGYRYECPRCAGKRTKILAGREMDVVSVELSVEGNEDGTGSETAHG